MKASEEAPFLILPKFLKRLHFEGSWSCKGFELNIFINRLKSMAVRLLPVAEVLARNAVSDCEYE